MKKPCDEVTEFLTTADARSRLKPPSSVRLHLEKCGPCRRMWEFLVGGHDCPEEAAAPGADSLAAIRATLGGSLAPVRPLPSRAALSAAFLGIFAAGVTVSTAMAGPHGAAAMSPARLYGFLLSLGLAAGFSAFLLSGLMLPGSCRAVSRAGVAMAGFLAALLAAAVLIFPWEGLDGWAAGARKCFEYGMLTALPMAIVAALVLRRGAVLSPGLAGAAAGLLGGLAGATMLHLACPMQGAVHITTGHLSAPLFMAAAGYLIGRAAAALSMRRAAQLEVVR